MDLPDTRSYIFQFVDTEHLHQLIRVSREYHRQLAHSNIWQKYVPTDARKIILNIGIKQSYDLIRTIVNYTTLPRFEKYGTDYHIWFIFHYMTMPLLPNSSMIAIGMSSELPGFYSALCKAAGMENGWSQVFRIRNLGIIPHTSFYFNNCVHSVVGTSLTYNSITRLCRYTDPDRVRNHDVIGVCATTSDDDDLRRKMGMLPYDVQCYMGMIFEKINQYQVVEDDLEMFQCSDPMLSWLRTIGYYYGVEHIIPDASEQIQSKWHEYTSGAGTAKTEIIAVVNGMYTDPGIRFYWDSEATEYWSRTGREFEVCILESEWKQISSKKETLIEYLKSLLPFYSLITAI